MTASTVAAMRAAWHRRRWLVVPAFLFPLVMGLSLVLFLPKMYRSTATVLIEGQQVPEAFVKATVTGEIETRIRGISEQVLSRSRLETLISRFNLYPELRGKGSAERAIAQMREDISLDLKSARASYGSTVVAFTIGFRGPDPVAVADVANALASFYIEENVKLRERQSSGTTSFLEAQLADTRKRLDEQERLVSAFNRRHLGELPSQMQANLATLESLNTQLRLNMDRQTRASDRRSILNRQVEDFNVMWSAARAAGAPSPAVGPAPAAVDPLMARRAQLQQELSVARTRYTESHPSLARLKAELAELERQVGAREVEPVPPGQPAPERPPAGLHPQAQRLHEAIAEIDVELKALSGEEQRLTADITTYRAGSRTRRAGSRSTRSSPATTSPRRNSTPRCSSATRKPAWPRAWSRGKKVSSSAFST